MIFHAVQLECNAYGQRATAVGERTNERRATHYFQRKSEKSDTLAHNLAGSHLFVSIFIYSSFSLLIHCFPLFDGMLCWTRAAARNEAARDGVHSVSNTYFNESSLGHKRAPQTLFISFIFRMCVCVCVSGLCVPSDLRRWNKRAFVLCMFSFPNSMNSEQLSLFSLFSFVCCILQRRQLMKVAFSMSNARRSIF